MLNSTATNMGIEIEYVLTKEEDNIRKLSSFKANTKESEIDEENLDLDDEDLSEEEKEKKKMEKLIKEQQKQQEILNQQLNQNPSKDEAPSKFTSWEHQNFYRKSVFAASLSCKKEKNSIKDLTKFNQNNILVNNGLSLIDYDINKDVLKRNIKLVSESLIGFLFNIENIQIFREDNLVNNEKSNDISNSSIIDELNIESLTKFFSKFSRNPLNITKGSLFNNELYTLLTNYLTKLNRQSFEYKEVKFYNSNSGIIKVNSVKSKMIDLYLLVAIIVYLLLLYLFVKGPKNVFGSLNETFSD